MERIIQGVHRFRRDVYPANSELYRKVAGKPQRPRALFITCADSRVDPNVITQSEPGELLVLRNMGNFVPPHAADGGESATIEYALGVLGIRNIIVCGHSQCGAIEALLDPDKTRELPSVQGWLRHAEATRRLLRERYGRLPGLEYARLITEENVLVQLNQLSTHPYVTAGLARGRLSLYGWYYDIESGQVFEYRSADRAFLPLTRSAHPVCPLSVRAEARGDPFAYDVAEGPSTAERVM